MLFSLYIYNQYFLMYFFFSILFYYYFSSQILIAVMLFPHPKTRTECILQHFCPAEIHTKKKTKRKKTETLYIPWGRDCTTSLYFCTSHGKTRSLKSARQLLRFCVCFPRSSASLILLTSLPYYKVIHVPLDRSALLYYSCACGYLQHFSLKTLLHIKWWQHYELYDFGYQN